MQTYHSARILLNLYAPIDDQKGMERLRQNRDREVNNSPLKNEIFDLSHQEGQAELQYHSRQLCGIASTNRCEAARIHASEHLRTCE
jgi:hypothetical protein